MVSNGSAKRSWLLFAAAGWLTLSACAASSAQEFHQGDSDKQKSSYKTQATPKIIPAFKSDRVAPAKPKTETKEHGTNDTKNGVELGSWPDWVMLLFTGFLAWLSWRQHVLEKRLAAESAETADIAKQSADAASKSADAALMMARSIRESERAHIHFAVHKESVKQIDNDIRVFIGAVNAGKTPGTVTRIMVGVHQDLRFSPEPVDSPDGLPMTVTAGQEIVFFPLLFPKVEGPTNLSVSIHYNDVFGGPHQSHTMVGVDKARLRLAAVKGVGIPPDS